MDHWPPSSTLARLGEYLQLFSSSDMPVQELSEEQCVRFATLDVRRRRTTVFNEYFSTPVDSKLFNDCVIKVQLCHVGGGEVAEVDHWIDAADISRFNELVLPLVPTRPVSAQLKKNSCQDLGELECELCYLPTAQRICLRIIQATNLRCKIPKDSTSVPREKVPRYSP